MANVHPYLTLPNTKEALDYYKDVFGAEIVLRYPVGKEQAAQFGVPEDQADNMTMHSEFKVLGGTVMAADNFQPDQAVHYDGITIMINVNLDDASEASAADAFWEKVSASGQVTVNMAYEEQFWGGKMGDITDKYGVRWMLHGQSFSQQTPN